MKEAALLLLQALGLLPNRLVLRALLTWPRSKGGATPRCFLPPSSPSGRQGAHRPQATPPVLRDPSSGRGQSPPQPLGRAPVPEILPCSSPEEARKFRRGSSSWAPGSAFGSPSHAGGGGNGQARKRQSSQGEIPAAPGPPSLPPSQPGAAKAAADSPSEAGRRAEQRLHAGGTGASAGAFSAVRRGWG